MIERTVPVTEEELHALHDRELPDDRRQEVEAWLAAHPEEAARVAAWRAQAHAIQARYAPVADEPIPERFDLDRLVRQGRPWRALAAAALIAAFCIGGVAGWFGHTMWDGAPAAKTLVSEALDAHRLYIAEVRHPIEVPANASHLMPWLSKRVGQPLRTPDLAKYGLKLIGGRLLPGPNGPAALFMYEGQSGERFTIYCARAKAPDSALRYRALGQVAAYYWIDSELMYVLSGPSDRERLHRVAESAYEQLEKRPGGRDRATEAPSITLVR
jgi:anti-sigma factor RsiW